MLYVATVNIVYRCIANQIAELVRIADGSLMPPVTTGNTMAPYVIIGERAGEILRADHKL